MIARDKILALYETILLKGRSTSETHSPLVGPLVGCPVVGVEVTSGQQPKH